MDLSAFVSVASLLLWAGAFLYFRSYLKRRTGAERLLAELREEVEKLVSEIDATTDRDATLVEERVGTLRALLDETDRRIASYARELDRRRAEERAYAELGRRSRAYRGGEAELYGGAASGAASPVPAPMGQGAARAPTQRREPVSSPEERPLPLEADRPMERAVEAAPSMRATQAVPEPSSGAATTEPGAGPRFIRSETPIGPKAAPFAERVAELYRAGFSADIIAKRLGATVAEVDLAIALAARTE